MQNDVSIGNLIKNSLEEKKITIDELYEKTKIPKKYLKAIVNDDYSNYPPKTFLLGYLKEISKLLQIDYSNILKILNKLNLGEQLNIEPKYKPILEIEKTPISFFRIFSYFFTFVAILVIGILIIGKFKSTNKEITPKKVEIKPKKIVHKNIQPKKEEEKKIIIDNTSAEIPPVKKEEEKPIKKIDNITLTIIGNELTWVRIYIDNETKKTYFVKKNDNITLYGKKFFKLDIGNAGGIRLIFNGKDLGFPGKRGEVKHIILKRGEIE